MVKSAMFLFRSVLLWSVLSSASFYAQGQDVAVHAEFVADSLMIGDETRFSLTAKYPSSVNLLFPDSTFNFTPFEFYRKEYFPTQTADGKSYDSVVYYLSTFEVDRVQRLSLPVFQLNPQDCTVYQSNSDSILLIQLTNEVPDTVTVDNLPLKVNIAYQHVSWLFNYPVMIGICLILLLLGVATWLIFGKRIRKHFRVKRLLKTHQQFLADYGGEVNNLQSTFSSATTELAMRHWKKYMEQLEGKPYTKLTTLETVQLEEDEGLKKNLQDVDRAIYGHNTAVVDSLQKLLEFADQRFTQKLEEVKHG